jgi:hypothetical protein
MFKIPAISDILKGEDHSWQIENGTTVFGIPIDNAAMAQILSISDITPLNGFFHSLFSHPTANVKY